MTYFAGCKTYIIYDSLDLHSIIKKIITFCLPIGLFLKVLLNLTAWCLLHFDCFLESILMEYDEDRCQDWPFHSFYNQNTSHYCVVSYLTFNNYAFTNITLFLVTLSFVLYGTFYLFRIIWFSHRLVNHKKLAHSFCTTFTQFYDNIN